MLFLLRYSFPGLKHFLKPFCASQELYFGESLHQGSDVINMVDTILSHNLGIPCFSEVKCT